MACVNHIPKGTVVWRNMTQSMTNFGLLLSDYVVAYISFLLGSETHCTINTGLHSFLFIRILLFQPRLNILIFLPMLG